MWTQAMLSEQTGAVGNGLLELMRPGETIASAVGNSAERVALQLGAACAGVKIADAGLGLTSAGLGKLLKEQNVRVLFVTPEQVDVVYETIPQLADIPRDSALQLKLDDFPALKYVCQTGLRPMNGTHRFKDVLVYNSSHDEISLLPEQDVPFLLEVDAATGAVKKELSQAQVLEQSQAKAAELKIPQDANVLFKAKNDYASNLCLATLACLQNNAQLVVPAEVYDEKACAAANEKNECAVAFA